MTKSLVELNFVLKQLYITKIKYDYKYEQSESFNIFKILHKWHDEEKLHSRFIASLLDPNGKHKKGKTYLDLLLKASFKNKQIDLGEIKDIETYPNENNKSEYNKLDILVINRKCRKALFIENKIFASESNHSDSGQVERYYDILKDEDRIPKENIYVIYLTLDGKEPSSKSMGKYKTLRRISGVPISYEYHIYKWLNLCLKETFNSPFQRETINQYIKLVQEMTNNKLDVEHRLELRDVITRNEEIFYAAKQLIDNFNHIKWHSIYDFWNEIEEELKDRHLKILKSPDEETITNIAHYELYKKGQRNKQYCGILFEVEKGFHMRIEYYPDEYWLYLGSLESDIRDESINESIDMVLSESEEYQKGNSWKFWKYLFENDEDKIYFSDFSHKGTFDLIKEDLRKEKITFIMKEVDLITNRIKENETTQNTGG